MHRLSRAAGMDFTQVEPGSFVGITTSLRLCSIRLFRDRFNIGLQRQGELAPGSLLVGTLADTASQARWFGMLATEDDVAVGRRSIDVSASGSGVLFAVLLDAKTVAESFADGVAGEPPGAGDAYFIRNAANARRLRALLQAVFALADAVPAALKSSHARKAVEVALVTLLRRQVEGRRIVPGASFGGRFQAVRICEAYMREHIDESISLHDLSELSGFRPRSLINAFEAFSGLSPMAYLKAQRLNGVRRTLEATSRYQARIIDVAMDWGFEHMGHFAAAYRAMFGERPSETARAPRWPRREIERRFSVDATSSRLPKSRPPLERGGAAWPTYAGLLELIDSESPV
jgi:AraC family ethanolamine operon transcriptional activator